MKYFKKQAKHTEILKKLVVQAKQYDRQLLTLKKHEERFIGRNMSLKNKQRLHINFQRAVNNKRKIQRVIRHLTENLGYSA